MSRPNKPFDSELKKFGSIVSKKSESSHRQWSEQVSKGLAHTTPSLTPNGFRICRCPLPFNMSLPTILLVIFLVNVSDICYLFLLGDREGGVRGARRGGEIHFLLKIRKGKGT